MRREPERKPLAITKDDDGGITVHDPGSGVVLSIISTHPAASGPHGLHIEAYAYETGKTVTCQDAKRPGDRHPQFALYAVNPGDEE